MIVIADKAGRLGNRLIVFSHVVGTALRTDSRVANPGFDEYAVYFRNLSTDPLCRFPPRRSRVPSVAWTRRLAYLLTRVLTKLLWTVRLRRSRWIGIVRAAPGSRLDIAAETRERGNVAVLLLQGWLLRNEEGLLAHSDRIREFLRPTEQIERRVGELLDRTRSGSDVLVGVHVRQTDYSVHLGGKFFFALDHFARVMQAVEALVPGKTVSFLVCSDTPKDPAAFPGLSMVPGTGNVAEDLFALAGCDFLVGPPSSFSLWASFYGRTPLFMMVRDELPGSLDDFRVAPKIKDEEVRALY